MTYVTKNIYNDIKTLNKYVDGLKTYTADFYLEYLIDQIDFLSTMIELYCDEYNANHNDKMELRHSTRTNHYYIVKI